MNIKKITLLMYLSLVATMHLCATPVSLRVHNYSNVPLDIESNKCGQRIADQGLTVMRLAPGEIGYYVLETDEDKDCIIKAENNRAGKTAILYLNGVNEIAQDNKRIRWVRGLPYMEQEGKRHLILSYDIYDIIHPDVYLR